MKHLLIALTLALTLTIPLFATMDFTQKETIPIANGTFSYAELRSVEGTDRIVAYSQDTDNIYLTISDTDGNVVESMSLAMTDSTVSRTMSYFEHEGEPRLAVGRVERGETVNNELGWTRTDQVIGELFNLETGNNLTTQIMSSFESYSETDYDYSSSSNYFFLLPQPVSYVTAHGVPHILIPFISKCNSQSWVSGGGGMGTGLHIRSFLFEFKLENDSIQNSLTPDAGEDIITGEVEGFPVVNAGRYASKYTYPTGGGDSNRRKYLYSNSCIMDESSGFGLHGELYYDRYFLLSNHYPNMMDSFTMISYDSVDLLVMELNFMECSMSGEILWTTQETTLAPEDFSESKFPSCCFTDDDDNPLTIYFAPDTTSYEIRNRLNGDIEDSGNAPFVPINIERTGDGTLVYLASTDNGVQVWHGAYTVGIDDPTDTPRFDLTANNYPNPFNPTTTISYSIPSTGHVELDVYNTRGQRVKTLVNDVIDAGEHEAVWHGDNDMGETVSSGVYLYRLKSADKKRYGRMLLLK